MHITSRQLGHMTESQAARLKGLSRAWEHEVDDSEGTASRNQTPRNCRIGTKGRVRETLTT